MKKKVLVLGAGGFTGSHLQGYVAAQELQEEYAFFGVDRVIPEDPAFPCVAVDLLAPGAVEDILRRERPNYILNLAGTFGSGAFETLIALNADLPRRLLACVAEEEIPVEKVLLVGSAAEYGDAPELPVTEEATLRPANPYGLSKVLQGEYARYYHRNHKVPVTLARSFNMVGKGLSFTLSIGAFAQRVAGASDGETIVAGNLEARRDFLPVRDVIDAYWQVLVKGRAGEAYNVCSGRSIPVRALLDRLIETSGKRLEVRVETNLFRADDIPDSYGDNSKLERETGWRPRGDLWAAVDEMLPGPHGPGQGG